MKEYTTKKKILILIIFLLFLTTFISIFIKKKVLSLLIALFLTIITIIFLLKNKKTLLIEAKSEIKNIAWPNKKEMQQSMLTIMLIIAVTSTIIWLIDSILTFIISKIV